MKLLLLHLFFAMLAMLPIFTVADNKRRQAISRKDPFEVERKVKDDIANGRGKIKQHCKDLIDQLKNGGDQSSEDSITATLFAELDARRTWDKVLEDHRKTWIMETWEKAIIAYVQDSRDINNAARRGDLTLKSLKNLDKALSAMQTVKVEMAKAAKHENNIHVTYRLNTYWPKNKPDGFDGEALFEKVWGSENDSNKNVPERFEINDIIIDKAFLSTSVNRQYMLKNPFDPITQKPVEANKFVKFVMIGYTGTAIGLQKIKTTNAKEAKKNEIEIKKIIEEELKKPVPDRSTIEAAKGRMSRAGEGEILYGRGTKWKIHTIDRTELEAPKANSGQASVYVCVEQVQRLAKYKYKSSFDGAPVDIEDFNKNDKHPQTNDFTHLYEVLKDRKIKASTF